MFLIIVNGEEMAKAVKVDKETFEATLRKLLSAPPVSLAKIPKSKKKLARVLEPIKPTR